MIQKKYPNTKIAISQKIFVPNFARLFSGRNCMLYLLYLCQNSAKNKLQERISQLTKKLLTRVTTTTFVGTGLLHNIDKSFTSNCFTVYFTTPKFGCRHLVIFAALLYGIRTRTIVELLTELCALPVVDGLTGRRWTTMIAR